MSGVGGLAPVRAGVNTGHHPLNEMHFQRREDLRNPSSGSEAKGIFFAAEKQLAF